MKTVLPALLWLVRVQGALVMQGPYQVVMDEEGGQGLGIPGIPGRSVTSMFRSWVLFCVAQGLPGHDGDTSDRVLLLAPSGRRILR